MKIHIQTLGCKVNQYESQAMETILRERGHEISLSPENCDAVIINSCSVTAESDRKSRQTVRHMKKLSPGAVIAVCGCFSQVSPEAASEIGADIVSGSGDHIGFLDNLQSAFEEKRKITQVDKSLDRRKIELLPAGKLAGRTRAMLKIQDGCSNYCTYCIIPYSRGPSRSMPLEEAGRQASELCADGYREFIITGIEIASYGRDLSPKATLEEVICKIAENAPGVRLRLGSLEPRAITESFCRRISEIPGLCDHFHLSLQSGCDETLKRMHRRYDTQRFYESVCLLRKFFPSCAIAADVITGFPGETDEEFSETMAFLEKCRFAFMHIFPYSQRPGTPAAEMECQNTKAVKKERAAAAGNLADRLEKQYLEGLVGSELEVLFEQGENGLWHGHSKNYCLVYAPGENLHNEVRKVRVTEAKKGLLLGNILL